MLFLFISYMEEPDASHPLRVRGSMKQKDKMMP